jgi:hypothetical protein
VQTELSARHTKKRYLPYHCNRQKVETERNGNNQTKPVKNRPENRLNA